jgi:YjbE family integral membrane protein
MCIGGGKMDLSALGLQITPDFWVALGKIIWINILLSGDNAIVIALACRGLPPEKRRMGIILGAGAAILLRIIFTIGINTVLSLPYLKLIGGVLLLWVAYKLLTTEEASEDSIAASSGLWEAVKTIAIADVVMSLDNVLAIAAAAKGNNALIILGLLISVPMIIGGATILTAVLQRFPILVWAGAALLGWIAGELIVTDPVILPYAKAAIASLGLPEKLDLKILAGPTYDIIAQTVGALLVILLGKLFRKEHGGAH